MIRNKYLSTQIRLTKETRRRSISILAVDNHFADFVRKAHNLDHYFLSLIKAFWFQMREKY